ncbi:RNA polymerase, sigma-24 subunit, ECF subfamily [Pirellula staleyi DSM 6068]|uniref:RNA polymerase, sigma-24 subunit, ECF subfamily n=1 Tax=Pirellula staleyi (strain ATCC 27377 / DSM 6068 / ICPB 4128) TaxID=530564 RepID=D2QYK7_PIRSD|nr:sigma-70 family RNA polymerase sigma factor [Pirellula staleyi]ADB18166.1 RNA polymerase, sigma-24 subunit, ECF subfamily [Pirellula staleyi DSM 6068]
MSDDSLLQTESPQPEKSNEAFLRLLMKHEQQIRAYIRACLPRSADVDEVMQEVGLVAWRKFTTLDDQTLFPRWVCLIARFEVLKFRRKFARDRLVLDDATIELLAAEGAEEMPLREQQLKALDDCVAKLSADRRQLVLAAYSPDNTIRSLAAGLARSEGSVYQLLARIRQELQRCVEKKLAAPT